MTNELVKRRRLFWAADTVNRHDEFIERNVVDRVNFTGAASDAR